MGFFDWLSGKQFEDYDNPYKVDNSPQAVQRRLTYLRLTPGWDEKKKARGEWIASDKFNELPREITYSVKKISYFVLLDPNNPSYCDIPDDVKWDTITNDIYNTPTSSAHIESIIPHNIIKPEVDVTEYSDNAIVPLSTMPGDEMDWTVPDEAVDALELSPRAKQTVFSDQLRKYFRQPSWRNPGTDLQYTTLISDDYASPSYHLGIALHLDIRINGIEADKCNLTITEQYELQQALINHMKEYSFTSDGREDGDALLEMSNSTYLYYTMSYDFKGLRDSIDNLSWYGFRNEAYNHVFNKNRYQRRGL